MPHTSPAGRSPIALLLTLVLGLSGCVFGTTQSLYDGSRDAVADPRLVGDWYADGSDVRIDRYVPRDDVLPTGPVYLFRVTSDPDRHQAVPYQIVPVGERRYLFPLGFVTGGQGTSLLGAAQIEVWDDALCLRSLDAAELLRRLQARPSPLSTRPVGLSAVEESVSPTTRSAAGPDTAPASHPSRDVDLAWGVAITDSPEVVRQYLQDHQDDPKLFVEPIVARRWVRVGER